MLVFGTRPEAIKMAPLILKLKSDVRNFDIQVCVTAQHRHMLDQVLELFKIEPDVDMNIMTATQDLFYITTNVLEGMKKILTEYQPDILLVHGDTTTTLAAAMAGFYANISVGHIEAGLRTYDLNAPFPEEFNRQMTSKIAKWHFAPTEKSRLNLRTENIDEKSIVVTGNTVIDALHFVLNRIEADSERAQRLDAILNAIFPFNWKKDTLVLITMHRRESFGEGVNEVCAALKEIASNFQDVKFIYPVHMNPKIRVPVANQLESLPNVFLIEPLEYEPFVYLLKHSYVVLTDSGGIQEEAPSLGKPVLVLREITERPEAVEAGTVKLVGTNRKRIVRFCSLLLEDKKQYMEMAQAHNPYGDGNACERILNTLRVHGEEGQKGPDV